MNILKIAVAVIAITSLSMAEDLKLYSSDGEYLGKLSNNKYDAESTSNPYGEYGSKYSTKSINNEYGEYGSKYSSQSPNNRFATDPPKLYDDYGNSYGTYKRR